MKRRADDGVLLVAGTLGVLAAAGAVARVQRGSRALDEDEQAVERLIGELYEWPASEIQRRMWEEEGRLVCPHGTEDFSLAQMLPVWWKHPEQDRAHPKRVMFSTSWDWEDQVGPFWCECYHHEPVQRRSLKHLRKPPLPNYMSWQPPPDIDWFWG